MLADGDAAPREVLDRDWPDWHGNVDRVIAADGGARHAARLGLEIDVWVGDGDSIDPAALETLGASGVEIHRADVDKDETDLELAIRWAIEAGAQQVDIHGALGGIRIDQGLANVALLGSDLCARVDAVMYDSSGAKVHVLSATDGHGVHVEHRLAGHVGDLVSLLPLGATARGVTTTNLRYPLRGEDLELGRTRGVSNVRTAPAALVRLESGRLLVIETPATVGR